MSYARSLGDLTHPPVAVVARGPSRSCDHTSLLAAFNQTELVLRALKDGLLQAAEYLRSGAGTPAQRQAAMNRANLDSQRAQAVFATQTALRKALAGCHPLNERLF